MMPVAPSLLCFHCCGWKILVQSVSLLLLLIFDVLCRDTVRVLARTHSYLIREIASAAPVRLKRHAHRKDQVVIESMIACSRDLHAHAEGQRCRSCNREPADDDPGQEIELLLPVI